MCGTKRERFPFCRFKHLFKPGNEGLIQSIQDGVDRRWEELRDLCGV
jgi:pyruvate ferredoxin oxidoreductase beta subunit